MPMCAAGDQNTLFIGQRVHQLGCHGTVRFIGEVASQTGVWVGVEWDDPSRGKHDGSYNGKQYFKTSHPTSGSLVRPSKLKTGCTCVEAIRTRYGKVEGSTAGVDTNLLLELKRNFNAPFFEVVGFDQVSKKQSDYKNLKVVCLENELVSEAGDPGQLYALCPDIEELNLFHSLIADWKKLGEITKQLPHLKHLNVSENRLSVPSEEDICVLQSDFKHLRQIVLNSVGYSWKEIIHCARLWPDVEVLLVQSNNITSLEAPKERFFSHLTVLSLKLNPLLGWEEVIKLGNLERLEELSVTETGLNRIFFPGEKSTTLFQHLRILSLADNLINDWNSINELNKLSSLECLIITKNPIMKLQLEQGSAFNMIVARIKGIQKLNGSKVTNQERKGCEYDYMKCYGEAWLAAQADPTLLKSFNELHPRYAELIKMYGAFEKGELTTKSAPLNSRMINVTIFSADDCNKPQFTKKLPKNMTIQKLAGLAQKLYNTNGITPSLTAISTKALDAKVALENVLQDLSYYSVEDGDSIAVHW